MSALLLVWLYGHSSNTVTVQSVSSRHHLPLPTKWKTSSPESVIPWVIDTQACCAGTVAGASGHRIVSANQIAVKFRDITIQIHGSKEGEGAVASVKFKPDSSAYDVAARRKCSWLDRYRTEAGRTERNCSRDPRATVQIGFYLIIEAARHSECLLLGSREGAVQRLVEIYPDAGDGSFVAVATATVDAVCAGEGGNPRVNVPSDSPSESNDLSFNRCGSERYVAASEGTGQAHGGQLIETIGTVDMQRGAGRRVCLADAAGKSKRRLPRDS